MNKKDLVLKGIEVGQGLKILFDEVKIAFEAMKPPEEATPPEPSVPDQEVRVGGIPSDVWKLLSNHIDITTGNFLTDVSALQEPSFRRDWFGNAGRLRRKIRRGLEALLVLKAYIWGADSDVVRLLGANRLASQTDSSTLNYWA